MDTISSKSGVRDIVGPAIAILCIAAGAYGIIKFGDAIVERRNKIEYVVTYYPSGGEPKVYDGVTSFQRITNGARFVYMGKEVEVLGNIEVVKK